MPINKVVDQFKRPIHDLRISVTDRCNFRCTYCMPKEVFGNDYAFLSKDKLLSFSEITRLSRLFVQLGMKKVRLTGGEPLLRKDLHLLIKKLVNINGIKDIGLTTNGVLLKQYGKKLFDAGLKRLNISLDALDPTLFGQINGRGMKPKLILENIDYAKELGFDLKVNMVVEQNVNDHEIIPMAKYFKQKGITLRFIEFMDVGNDNQWSYNKVVTKQEMMEILQDEFELKPLDSAYFGEVAQRYRYKDNSAQIGFITSVSESFCSTCTRARLSSDGKLFTCLFASSGYDLRELLRSDYSDQEILEEIISIWEGRKDRYSDLRS